MATKGDLTFRTLKEGTGMTDKLLCKYIDEQQCRKLAGLFGSWKKYVDTPGLGLTPSQIADVQDCALKHGNEMAMSTALRVWLNYNLFKTYRSLIEILLELNEGSLAVKLATYVVENYAEQTQILTTTADTEEASSNKTPSGDISDNIQHFEKRFQHLKISTLKHLTENDVPLTELEYTLLALPLAIRNEHEKLLLSKYSMVEKATTVCGVFAILNSYLSFIDYSLLEHIIDNLGSDALKQSMKDYARDMTQFRKDTTINDIIPHIPRRLDHHHQGFAEMKVKLDFDVQTTSLEDIDQYRKQLASEFLLSDFALLLASINPGSVHVVWLIPVSVISFLKQYVKDKGISSMLNLQILRLSVNMDLLYPPMRSEAAEQITAELRETISHLLNQQAKVVQLHEIALPTIYQKEELQQLQTTVKQIQDEVEKIRLTSQKKEIPQDLESWLVPSEQVSYTQHTPSQNLTITTKGTFKGATVAVKRMNQQSRQETDRDVILEEIRIMSQIRHPNVIQFIAATANEKARIMIVTEFIETSLNSLDTYRRREFNIGQIMKDVALALVYLHTHRVPIIHRDVRPENILLLQLANDRWMAKLSGFGSAIFAQDANTPYEIRPEARPYIAPEAQTRSSQQTTKIDVYSFGMVMQKYESLINTQRFRYSTRPRYSLTMSCLSYSPRDRPNMNAVLEQFEHWDIFWQD